MSERVGNGTGGRSCVEPGRAPWLRDGGSAGRRPDGRGWDGRGRSGRGWDGRGWDGRGWDGCGADRCGGAALADGAGLLLGGDPARPDRADDPEDDSADDPEDDSADDSEDDSEDEEGHEDVADAAGPRRPSVRSRCLPPSFPPTAAFPTAGPSPPPPPWGPDRRAPPSGSVAPW
jgi:hypothetical protein